MVSPSINTKDFAYVALALERENKVGYILNGPHMCACWRQDRCRSAVQTDVCVTVYERARVCVNVYVSYLLKQSTAVAGVELKESVWLVSVAVYF